MQQHRTGLEAAARRALASCAAQGSLAFAMMQCPAAAAHCGVSTQIQARPPLSCVTPCVLIWLPVTTEPPALLRRLRFAGG